MQYERQGEKKLGGARANLSTLEDASDGVDNIAYPAEFSRGSDWPCRRVVGVAVNKQQNNNNKLALRLLSQQPCREMGGRRTSHQ